MNLILQCSSSKYLHALGEEQAIRTTTLFHNMIGVFRDKSKIHME